VRVLELVASDPGIDVVIIEMHPMMARHGGRKRAQRMMESLVEFAAPHRSSKPIVVAMRSGDNLSQARVCGSRTFLASVPVFRAWNAPAAPSTRHRVLRPPRR
jgi:hypothetical protein